MAVNFNWQIFPENFKINFSEELFENFGYHSKKNIRKSVYNFVTFFNFISLLVRYFSTFSNIKTIKTEKLFGRENGIGIALWSIFLYIGKITKNEQSLICEEIFNL